MSLALLIAGLKAGLADFNVNAPRGDDAAADAYAAVSYEPALAALRAFDGAADNHATAVMALETALDEIEDGDHETATVLVRAALGFFNQVAS